MFEEMNFAGRDNRFFAAFDLPGSAAAVLPERAAPEHKTENPIIIDDTALPYLVGERKILAEEMARLMAQTAARYGLTGEVRISKITPMPMYGLTKILQVKQTLATNGNRAMQYHDELAAIIDPWAASLPEAQENTLFGDILMDIEWDLNAPED